MASNGLGSMLHPQGDVCSVSDVSYSHRVDDPGADHLRCLLGFESNEMPSAFGSCRSRLQCSKALQRMLGSFQPDCGQTIAACAAHWQSTPGQQHLCAQVGITVQTPPM